MSTTIAASYGAIPDGAVAVRDGKIVWVGPEHELPDVFSGNPTNVLDLESGWLTPGLIDAHTHLVFGGTRAAEFEQRLSGATYEEIARAGGGILSTVRATRAATEAELFDGARRRLRELMRHGVTTVEIKSGYGLDVDTEMRMLRVARSLGESESVTVSTTLLAAHAVPPGVDRSVYLDLVCNTMIPRAVSEGLADAVDAFCEGIAFTADECERVLRDGARHGLGVRLHADQLSDLGGAALAARLGARSADHIEYTSASGVSAMAGSGTAAVLLPGAYYFLGETQRPPVDELRSAGVPIVVATDLNPGSSPVASPLLAMNLACVLFSLTPEEALIGMTRNAAPVLGLDDRGTIEVGRRADLAAWSIAEPSELSYWMGANPCRNVVNAGRLIAR